MMLNHFAFRNKNPKTYTSVFDCSQFSRAARPVHFGAACADCGLRGLYEGRQFRAVGF